MGKFHTNSALCSWVLSDNTVSQQFKWQMKIDRAWFRFFDETGKHQISVTALLYLKEISPFVALISAAKQCPHVSICSKAAASHRTFCYEPAWGEDAARITRAVLNCLVSFGLLTPFLYAYLRLFTMTSHEWIVRELLLVFRGKVETGAESVDPSHRLLPFL